jgi:aconitate hydratase 2/2-methylisocitrate dehydratase
MSYMSKVDATASDTYRYLNFDELPEFVEASDKVEISEEMREAAKKLSIM